jgi:Methyl-accepting chemotaxis protein (MCP) signalling domain
VNKTGSALDEIAAAIKEVAELVSDIAGASLEQSNGVDQVNKALTQMDEVTQRNAALVEENAATAKTLEQQAKVMDERVGYFLLAHGHAAASAAKPARRRGAPRLARQKAGATDTPPIPKRFRGRPNHDLVTEAANRRRSGWRAAPSLHCLVDERPGEHQPAQPFARERGDFSSNRHPAPPSICA